MTETSPIGVPVRFGSGRTLSPMQRALWASQLNNPDAPVQNMARLTQIHGPIDPDRLARAFDSVVVASDVLRTRVSGTGADVTLVPVDQLPQSEIVTLPADEVMAWAEQRATDPIDLSVVGYDSAIATHPDGTVTWFLNMHHVITDAKSSSLVLQATAEAYFDAPVSDPADGPVDEDAAKKAVDPTRSYYGWARDLAATLEKAEKKQTKRALAHWRDRKPAEKVGRLYTANETATPKASKIPLALGQPQLAKIEERLASDYRMLTDDLAWSTLLTTAMALYIHRVGGADQFSIGLPVHHRNKADTAQLIGPTMEVFPVDITVERSDTFRSLHGRVAGAILETLTSALPGTSPTGDFEAVVNVIPALPNQGFGPLEVTTTRLHSGAIDAGHLVRIQRTVYPRVADGGGPLAGFEIALDINDGATGSAHRARVGGHFTTILNAMMFDPDDSIGAETLCGPDERDVLRRWETGPDFGDKTPLLADRLGPALAERGDPAIDDGDRSFTGAELLGWAVALAKGLQQQGVGRGVRVGVDLPRSIEAVVSVLGVHLAGGSFVPLDQKLPAEKRQRLSNRASCLFDISSPEQLNTLVDDAADAELQIQSRSNSDEAYLLYTSGSTGEPKGVPITDLGLARYLRFAEETYVDPDVAPPIAPLFSALTFDLTITTLFVPLLAGGKLIVVEQDGPSGLSAIAARPEITWCKATPSHLEILARILPDDHQLRTLIVGGEAFGTPLASRLTSAVPHLRLFNEYGPTEAVVGCMDYRVEQELLATQPDVPIGRPAPGVTLRVVDSHLRRVPIGSPGELLIAHTGLTAGYLASPEDTVDPDVQSDPESDTEIDTELGPFLEIDGQRFYRSGDLVRLQDDQRLVYLGRRDEQVKVGGIRLEPVEVEAAIDAHPMIERSAVRLWAPTPTAPSNHCVRCGLPDNIPGVDFDSAGVCQTCHDFDRVEPLTTSWFKTTDDLQTKLAEVRARATGDYDCVHLLSGGKDSTYALYQLVELGFRPYALTLDNGFISEGAKENVRRSVAELGIGHEFATSKAMNAIFRDSLERHSNVCHGCYKTIYTLATNRAAELGAPLIVTGLSRGQLFETRLIPQQFTDDRFDPEAIDRAVIEARKVYHRADDGPNRLLDTKIFEDDRTFEQIEYLDFFRYVDVELAEMLDFLTERAPWVRPADTGRSTNCLINAAGIHTHQTERGYHNYAEPYAWDVRLGHKTRDEAIEELDDQLDLGEVSQMLSDVGYQPKARQILTAWLSPVEGAEGTPSPTELRSFLAESLPGHAIPSAFVAVDELPLTENGKLDTGALPAPDRVHRSGPTVQLLAATPLERTIINVWERILKIEPIGPEDDFFSLGGDSLAALETIVALGEDLGDNSLGEDLAFTHTTPRSLGAAIELRSGDSDGNKPRLALADFVTGADEIPVRSPGELAILFDQADRQDDVMYNVGRVFQVDGTVDPETFEQALRAAAKRHQTLSWSHGNPRRHLSSEEAVQFTAAAGTATTDSLSEAAAEVHRTRFDLENGPLLRCLVQPIDDDTTAVVLAIHHASGDAASFVKLWEQINQQLAGDALPEPVIDYAGFNRWQQDSLSEEAAAYWLQSSGTEPAADLAIAPPQADAPAADGFLTRTASITWNQLQAGATTGPAALVLAAVGATVRSYSTGPDVEIGLITSTRNHPSAEDLFGYFLNTVPVRLTKSAEHSDAALSKQASVAMGEALANRIYPTARIVSDRRAAGRPEPKLDVLMAFDHLDYLSLEGAPTKQWVLHNGAAVAPLTFFIEVRGADVDISLEHRGADIPSAVAEDLLDSLDSWLLRLAGSDDASDEPESTTSSLLIGAELSEHRLVLDLINDQFGRQDQTASAAVSCGQESLTWAELRMRSAAIGQALVSAGVSRGDRVVLCLDRSVNLVAAILGIQLVGAAYVPIDSGYPDARKSLIAGAAGAGVGVVSPSQVSLVGSAVVSTDVGVGDQPWETLDAGAFDLSPLGQPVSADDSAYVIFTSGSTGQPRGVPVTHGQLAASTGARQAVYLDPPSSFLTLSSPAFDSSIVGLFWTLASGGTVVLPTEDEAHDLRAISALLEAGPSHTLMVPTLYRGLLALRSADPVDGDHKPWAGHVIVAGEACPPSLVAAHYRTVPTARLTNEYGPTEATVWATAHHCSEAEESIPIGPPIPGTWVAILDDEGAIRPAGVTGELVIGGRNVVDGYLNAPEITASKFGVLDRPGVAETNRRYFKTGDRATVVDGTVWFLGRSDTQLNVGGLRAEPEDLENALLTDVGGGLGSSITEVLVTAIDLRRTEDLLTTLPGSVTGQAMAAAASAGDPAAALRSELLRSGAPELRIVAHVEATAESDLAKEAIVAELRHRAAANLPAPLRPGHYELHQELPRTPNGKLDRAAAAALVVTGLGSSAPAETSSSDRTPNPAGQTDHGTKTADSPSVALVNDLAELFGQTLRVPSFGADDSFFDSGGHSLLAMELLLDLEDRFGKRLSASTLYDAPTPRLLAERLEDQTASRTKSFLVPIQPDGTRIPIFAVHVLGIDCAFFRPLSEELGQDQPMYGLGQPTDDLDTVGPTDVAGVAAGYVEAINQVAPTGPVALAAISLGGVVAYELAQQLITAGREVQILALFDALGPDADTYLPSIQEKVEAHLSRAKQDPGRYLTEQAEHQAKRFQRTTERANLAVRKRLNLRSDHRLEIRRFIEENVSAQAAYAFDPYPGDMLVVKAGDDPFAAMQLEAGMGWTSVAGGTLDVAEAPGGHLSMMEAQNVGTVATVLREVLDRSADSDRASSGDGANGADPDRPKTERLLIAGLQAGKLAATLAALDRRDDLGPESTRLAAETDGLLRALATTTETVAHRVTTHLGDAGLTAELMPIPRHLQHATATIRLADNGGNLQGPPQALRRLMADLDFHPVGEPSYQSGQSPGDTDVVVSFVRREDATSRIRVLTSIQTPKQSGLERLRTGAKVVLQNTPLGGTGDGTATGAQDLGIFLGTPLGLISPLLTFAGFDNGQHLTDLGCGDGRVLIEAAQAFGGRARGYETDADLVSRARAGVKAAGLSDRVEIVHGDAASADLAETDLVFLFLPPETVTEMLSDVLAKLPPDAGLLSHEQLLTRFPIAPDSSGLVLGYDRMNPAASGITVASLWHGYRA